MQIERAFLFTSTAVLLRLAFCGFVWGGSFSALAPGGVEGDDRLSVLYYARTGEVAFESPVDLVSMLIESDAGIFTGDPPRVHGSFETVPEHQLFTALFRGTFTSWSFGSVAQEELADQFLLSDLSVVASTGDALIEDADLIYVPVPEPGTLFLVSVGLLAAARAVVLARPTARASFTDEVV